MEKKPITYKSFLKKVAAATDCNDHTEARIIIAKYFEFGSQLEELQSIESIQNRLGFMPQELINERTAVTKKMMNLIVAKCQSEEIMKQVYSNL